MINELNIQPGYSSDNSNSVGMGEGTQIRNLLARHQIPSRDANTNLKIYQDYDGGTQAGISAHTMCTLLDDIYTGIKAQCQNSNKLETFKEKLEDIATYICDNSRDGFLNFTKQEEVEEIYYKLSSLMDSSENLDSADFKPSEVIRAFKRLFYTQAAEFMYKAAAKLINPSNERRDNPNGSGSASGMYLSAYGGPKIGLENVASASITGGFTVGTNTTEAVRSDDQTMTVTNSNYLKLGANMTLGVGGLLTNGEAIANPPTGAINDTALNIAGAKFTAEVVVNSKEGRQLLPQDWKLVKLQDFMRGSDSQDPNLTKSSRPLNFFRDLWHASDARELGFTNSFFRGAASKEKGSMPDLIDILNANKIVTHVNQDLQNSQKEAELNKLKTKHNDFLTGKTNLPLANTIASYQGTSVLGGVSASASAGNFASTGFQVSHEYTWWEDYQYHNHDIDLEKYEVPFFEKLVQKGPQHSYNEFNNSPMARKLADSLENYTTKEDFINRFTRYVEAEMHELIESADELSKNILKYKSKKGDSTSYSDKINNFWKHLLDSGLISKAQHSDPKVKEFFFAEPDRMAVLAINALTGHYAACLKVVKESPHVGDLADLLSNPGTNIASQCNHILSRSLSFFVDEMWRAATPGHVTAREQYHTQINAQGPSNERRWCHSITKASGNINLAPKFNALRGADGMGNAHTVNFLGANVQLSLENTENHPGDIRNKSEFTISLTGTGLLPSLLALGNRAKTAYDEINQISERMVPENLVSEKDKSTVINAISNGLLQLHSALMGTDSMTNSSSVVPTFGSSAAFAGNVTLSMNVNLSTCEIDSITLSTTSTKGLNPSSSSVPQPIPFKLDIGGGTFSSKTDILYYSVQGLYACIGAARSINLDMPLVFPADIKDDTLANFLSTLKAGNRLQAIANFATQALKLKNEPNTDRLQTLREYGGATAVDNFHMIFRNANIENNDVQIFESAIEHLKSATFNELEDNEKLVLKKVLTTWSNATKAAQVINSNNKKTVQVQANPQAKVVEYSELLNKAAPPPEDPLENGEHIGLQIDIVPSNARP